MARMESINVRACGAKGDGLSDDSRAIQQALNVGRVVRFPPGVYRLGSGVTIGVPGQTLIGDGATLDARALDNTTTTHNPAIRGLNVNGISIVGLSLIGPDPSGSAEVTPEIGGVDIWNTVGIYLSNCDHCQVRDCRFTGFFRGGVYVVGDYNSITGCHFQRVRYREPSGGCIFISGNHHSVVANNVIIDAWGCGIGLQNSTHIAVTGNAIRGVDFEAEPGGQTMGICAINCHYCTYVSNTIRDVTDEGIVLTTGSGKGCNYNTITGNTMHNCRLYGVALYATGGTQADPHTIGYNAVSANIVIADAEMFNNLTMEVALYIKTDGPHDYAKDNLFMGNIAHGNGNQIVKGFATSGINITGTEQLGNILRV